MSKQSPSMTLCQPLGGQQAYPAPDCKSLFPIRVCGLSRFSRVQLFVILWGIARQVPLSMDSPGKNTGMGCHFLLQGISPTHGLTLHLPQLLQYRQIPYRWATGEAPHFPIPCTYFSLLYHWMEVHQLGIPFRTRKSFRSTFKKEVIHEYYIM